MTIRTLPLALSLLLAAPAFAQTDNNAGDDQETKPTPTVTVTAPVEGSTVDEQERFRAFIRGLRPQALAAGVRPQTFDREISDLTFNPRVIRLDSNQPGGGATSAPSANLNFTPYKTQHVDAGRIQAGRRRYPALRPRLAAIEQKTGVPEAIMLSIYGHETGYGSFSGNFDILRSFASLAFEGRRRALFTSEFIDTLLLIDRGVPRSTLQGSWAGATGYPQFLPSTYLRLGIDGDGDGKADIWRSEPDALASIGNYLLNAGWKPDVPWGVAASVPVSFDRTSIRPLMTSPRCPRVHARLSRWASMAEWKAKGIIVTGANPPADDEQATLIEPDGPGKTAYLVSDNYQVILDYNCSNFYALAVGLLADEVAK